ncbi:MAG: lipopolysaccharide assembly protein LapA domain-containing protein [Cyanobacteria bacterium J06635_1]
MPLFIIFALVIAFFAIAFALQNNNLITINLFIWQLKESLAIVLLSTLAIGVIIGLLVTIPALIKRDWRISRGKKQAAGLEAQLIEKERELATQANRVGNLRQSYNSLLKSLNLTDPTTGLLHSRLLHPTLTTWLHQMNRAPLNDQLQSLALMTIQAQRIEPAGVNAKQDAALWGEVAALIQHNLTADAWLFSDSDGRFMGILTGFDLKAVTTYAETLHSILTGDPITAKDGQRATVDIYIGGVVTDREHPTESETLMLEKAEQAIAQAEKRGKNHIRIIRVTD